MEYRDLGYESDLGLDEFDCSMDLKEDNSEDDEGPNEGNFVNPETPTECEVRPIFSLPNLHPDLEIDKILNEFKSLLSVGTSVSSFENAYSIYSEYGRCRGFGVRRSNQKYAGQSKVVKWKDFVCSCEGSSDAKSAPLRVSSYKKSLLRSGCKAKIRVSSTSEGVFNVSRFEDDHNHVLVPREQTYMLRSSRNLNVVHQRVVESMDSLGIGVNLSCGFLEQEYGGPQSLGFTRQDAYDHMKRVKRCTKLENSDANCVMQYFISKSYAERDFFWKVQMDDDGRLMNFFFRDSRCAQDYNAFGDVVCVDSTYRTNRYNLICTPFVGINHHSLNVMFGMAFLSDETTSTFEWLFRMFMQSMGGVQPKLIFTDQCVAMMNAIDKVFPNSKHRLCQWHINKNAPSHFGSLNSNEEFKKMWYFCMNGVENESEFEELWGSMMASYNLTKNAWFKNMYKIRTRWASVFTQHIFSAGLHATSRSEATNRALKLMKNSKRSLLEFVRNYEKVVCKWRKNEREEDTMCFWPPGQIVDGNPLLKHAASIFTRSVYKMFESELVNSFCVVLCDHRTDAGDGNFEFSATTAVGSRPRKVLYNVHTDVATCSCRMLETDGYFCRHVLKVYSVMNVFNIPMSQVLKRWSKNARDGYVACTSNLEPGPSVPYMNFVNDVLRHMQELAVSAIDSSEARKMIRERVESLHAEVLGVVGQSVEDANKRNKLVMEIGCSPYWSVYRDPVVIKEKGWTHAREHWNSDKQKGKQGTKKSKINRRTALQPNSTQTVPAIARAAKQNVDIGVPVKTEDE